VPEPFLAQIQASADAHGRNASEELMWLAERGLILEAAFVEAGAIREKAANEARALLAEAKRVISDIAKTGVRAELRQLGYSEVYGADLTPIGWCNPGVSPSQWFTTMDPERRAVLQDMFNQAAAYAAEKPKEAKS
jgi:hypothetical protein